MDVILDFEISMIKAFGWSLYEIDRTDMESMIDFINRVGATAPAGSTLSTPGNTPGGEKRVFIDQVNF